MEMIEQVIEFGKWLCDDLELLFGYEVSIRYLTYNLVIAKNFYQKAKSNLLIAHKAPLWRSKEVPCLNIANLIELCRVCWPHSP